MTHMKVNLFTEHARELLKMPPEWESFSFESLMDAADTICVTGAVAPRKTKGKNKGHCDFKKIIKSTERKAYFTLAEHREWMIAWEQKTGMCADCTGTGKKLKRWSREGGAEYMCCSRCGGSGKLEAPKI